MAVDLSLRATGVPPEAVRESPVDRSGAVFGQTMATASNIRAAGMQTQAAGIYSQAEAAQSFGRVATNVGEVATNAIIGHQKAQLNKELNSQMDDWIAAKKNPEELRLGVVQADKLDELQPSIWDALGKGDINSGTFADSVNAFSNEAQALRAAHEQGMMQPSEFVTRLKATIRKHAAANPGLAEELYQDGMKTLQMSGVMDLQDAKLQEDKAAIKRKEMLDKSLISEMNKYGVEYDPYKFEYEQEALWNEVNRKRGIHSVVGDYESGDKMYKLTTSAEVNTFWRGDAPKLAENHNTRFAHSVSEIINSGVPEDQQLSLLDNLIRDSGRIMDQLFEAKGVAADPNAAKYRESFQSYAKATRDQIANATTQSEKLKIIETKNKITEELSKENIYKDLDPATIQLINNLPIPMMESLLLKMNQPGGIGDTLISRFSKVISEGLRSTANTKEFFTEEGASEPKITNGAATMMQLIKHGQLDALDKVLEGYEEAQNKHTFTEAEQFNNMDDFAKISARPDNLKQMQELSEEGKGRMQRLAANYMVMLGKSFNGLITQTGLFNTGDNFRGADFKVKDLPNGGILFEAGDSKLEAKLNKEYANRYNNLVRVSSKIFNLPEKTVGETYKAIFDQTFQMGEVGRVGLQGQVSEGVDNLIRSLESGGNPDAPHASNAVGPDGFMPDTFKNIVKRYMPEVAKGKSDEEILALRKDKGISGQATAALRRENSGALQNAGVPVNDISVIAAHFFGAPEAIKFFKAGSSAKVEDVLKPGTIGGHKWIKPGMTVQQALGWIEDKVEKFKGA